MSVDEATGSEPAGTLAPLRPRARWIVAALVIAILVDVLAIRSDLRELSIVGKVINGEFVSLNDLDANDTRQSAIGVANFGLFVVCVVLFLLWFSRAYRNLPRLGVVDREASRQLTLPSA